MIQNKNIVVLGCPRSGTSLLANLIRSAGYNIDGSGSKKLMKPNFKYNPDGYFERIDIVKLNDAIIKQINSDYSFLNPPSLREIQNFDIVSNELTEINHELSNTCGWIIKDSRLSFTLHAYKNLNNVHIIKIIRDPKEVKQSMINHYGDLFTNDITHGPHEVKKINFDYYYNLINNCIDWQKTKFDNITIQYNDLINNKLKILEKFIGAVTDRKIINANYRNFKM